MSEQADALEQFAIVGDHLVGEVFDGEAIIIDTVTGAYYSLPDGAAQIWSALAAGAASYDEIGAASAADSDLLLAVLGELVEEGLVVSESAVLLRVDGAQRYLSKYSDMEELLLLDPIHDVAPIGWPAEFADPSTSDPAAP